MTLIPSVFISLGGVLAALLITWPAAYWISGTNGGPRSLWLWCGVGLGFGVLLPFLTGALLPLSFVFIHLATGIVSLGKLWSQSLDAAFRAPQYSFVQGGIGLFSGLLAGALLGIGAWVIDRINSFPNPIVRRYGPWVASLLLASIVVGYAVLGPPETLARLG